ncbi:LysR family transcriptional regulator [Janthinobacterium agaricidamnosum]|uniref:Bacterial regulatory helix-turn-helix, lysR family protein n=1 Tax=Janthinobacterium agaricidamnosum NBRC 102515 = DSM 9628 TaxID=1349767 RepID=W0V022_9BURK|nr:LysR family transcriptional regulator [Janthinobacterium agaricidamnosum]CDG81226.1 bacterial regulatory helix-turn-helix, lysR family protein [Janthinobacterium agaricidamnosum NBRC 102515 = DSM 9628]
MYIAQSALSRQIKELKNELETALLVRDARHIELTPAGSLFHEHCKRLLDDIAATILQTQQVGKGGQGTIRLLHSSSVNLTEQLAQSTVGLMYRRDPTPLVAGFIAAFEAGLLRLN